MPERNGFFSRSLRCNSMNTNKLEDAAEQKLVMRSRTSSIILDYIGLRRARRACSLLLTWAALWVVESAKEVGSHSVVLVSLWSEFAEAQNMCLSSPSMST